MREIYLDYNATTPVDDAVLTEMLPFFRDRYANASSFSHQFGRNVAEAVERARQKISEVIGAESKDIIFTSGATEAINLAIKGVAGFYGEEKKHIITTQIEHKAVLNCCEFLQEEGFRVDYVGVDRRGKADIREIEKLMSPETILVSVQHANNEIGTVQEIGAIGAKCRAAGIYFHVDAAQSFGKIPIDVDKMNIDLLSISGHKIYAPKGIGALYVRRKNPRVRLKAQIHGGLQEREMRAGTLNVPGIIELGKAAEIAVEKLVAEKVRLQELTDLMMKRLKENLENVEFNGACGQELPGNLSITIDGIEARELLCSLPEIMMSTGSACVSALSEPSHVLRAIGLGGEMAAATFRVGLGRWTSRDEIVLATDAIVGKIKELRKS